MGRPCYSSATPLRCSGSRWRLPPRRPSKIGTTAGAAADAEVDEAVEEAADAVVDEEVDAAPARPTTGPHLLAAHPKWRQLALDGDAAHPRAAPRRGTRSPATLTDHATLA